MSWLNKVKKIATRSYKQPTTLSDKDKESSNIQNKQSASSEVASADTAKPDKQKSAQRAAQYLIKPIVSEKAAHLAEAGKYMFEVALGANKIEIKKAVEELYGVNVMMVNIMNVRGRKVRWGRYYGKRKNWKRAIVSLKKGQSLDLYEGV